ncbi:hypothetical protein GCM10029963_65030 [Micromonospora andamanensis]|uniref:alkaline phosphatase D family protein n=1 Tax=Micromonospora andamanensis TaxID=1287068 RepID=UPI001950D704|nr:alkaline phosphatase D family protein [Micromonospora andamanensis]GIJ37464.1 hypothetical protein Vwe01_07890 [Micromonospora andamanensis]
MSLSRRTILLSGLAAGAAGAVVAGGALPASAAPAPSRTRALSYPFTLGVASGDPDHEGFVLWTRLAPQPLAEDGLGGMPDRTVPVFWELAADERFRHVVRRGVVDAHAASAHSVHVELAGLLPGREYFYRFRVQRHLSPVGRTRTAPAPWSLPATLAMAFASCSQYEHGYFTAYRQLAETEPEIVLHLGDYQYEYARDTYTAPGGNLRDHEGPETRTLANYRQRHAQYKTDPDLQAAHAVAPWAVVFDDLLAQQVFFAQRDRDSGPLTVTSMDAWDGYLASRDRITRGWLAAGVRNPVVLTGDVHAHWASDLKLDYADPTSRTVGSELVCSSITSGGDGADSATGSHPWLAWNPHPRFHNNLRGYVRTTITREQLTADFAVLPYVSSPGAPARTRARFVIEDRVPGLHLTRDEPPAATRAAGPDADAGQRTVESETRRP